MSRIVKGGTETAEAAPRRIRDLEEERDRLPQRIAALERETARLVAQI